MPADEQAGRCFVLARAMPSVSRDLSVTGTAEAFHRQRGPLERGVGTWALTWQGPKQAIESALILERDVKPLLAINFTQSVFWSVVEYRSTQRT